MLCNRCGCFCNEQVAACPMCGEPLDGQHEPEPAVTDADTPGSAPAPEPAQPAPPLRYAGFCVRFWAFMLDGAVLAGMSLLVFFAGVMMTGPHTGGLLESAGGLLPAQVAADSLMKAVYFIYFHAVTGQTVGKRAFGLKVVREGGQEIGWARSAVRYAGACINMLAFGLGYIWVVFDSRKQGWHDTMAGSFVVRVHGQGHAVPDQEFAYG